MRLTVLATIDLTDPNSQQKQLELFESLRDDPQALQDACVQLCQDGAHTKPQVFSSLNYFWFGKLVSLIVPNAHFLDLLLLAFDC